MLRIEYDAPLYVNKFIHILLRTPVQLIALFACLGTLGKTFAEDAGGGLLGEWGPHGSLFSVSGVELNMVVTNDIIGNVSGGVRRQTKTLGNIDFTAEVDTASAGLWENGTFFVYGLGNYGGDPTSAVGDMQASDNIETFDTAKIYEAWYNHSLFDNRVEVLFGLHDYNSEFDVLETAGVLLNSSFGISPDISQVGPSIFSTTSLAGRLKVSLLEQLYIQSALYDGVPGNPDRPRGTHIDFERGDGVFWGSEIGWIGAQGDRRSKVAAGTWYHTADFEDYSEKSRDENGGVYLIGEYQLHQETDPEQGLSFFLQTGSADQSRNQIGHYYGGGLTYQGLLPSRDCDILSMGIAIARNSSGYRSVTKDVDVAEYAYELTYRIEVTPYFAIQPDLQFIVNPGTNPALNDAVVLGLRTEVGL